MHVLCVLQTNHQQEDTAATAVTATAAPAAAVVNALPSEPLQTVRRGGHKLHRRIMLQLQAGNPSGLQAKQTDANTT